MSIKTLYLRTRSYLQRHGARPTIYRALVELRNGLFFNRDVIFFIDLMGKKYENYIIPKNYVIERVDTGAQISDTALRRFAEHQAMDLVCEKLKRRFSRGATLWCLKENGEFVGYIWSVRGKPMKPYSLPLTNRDIHFFDNFIFPQYRGQQHNSILLNEVIKYLKNQCVERAYIETAEWNNAELKSLEKIGFIRIGFVRKTFRGGKTL